MQAHTLMSRLYFAVDEMSAALLKLAKSRAAGLSIPSFIKSSCHWNPYRYHHPTVINPLKLAAALSDPLYHKYLRGQMRQNLDSSKLSLSEGCHALVPSESPADWSVDRYPWIRYYLLQTACFFIW